MDKEMSRKRRSSFGEQEAVENDSSKIRRTESVRPNHENIGLLSDEGCTNTRTEVQSDSSDQ